MKLLTDRDIDPEDEAGGWNVLHLVCRHYHGDELKYVVDFLIKNGVSGMTQNGIEEINRFGLTPFSHIYGNESRSDFG